MAAKPAGDWVDTWHRVSVNPKNADMDSLTQWLDTVAGEFGRDWRVSYGLDEIRFYFADEKHANMCTLGWAS